MTIKVELFGKFYDNHSFSIINRYLAKELLKNENIDLYISNVDNYNPLFKISFDMLELIDELKNKRINLEGTPDILLLHTYPPIWRWPTGNNTKVICYQHWEYPRIPFEWQYKWENYADAICCSSNWTKENILNAGIDPDKLYVVTPGINPDIFKESTKKDKSILNTEKFVFTYVGCGQFRKGLDILLEGWAASFAKADKTVLFIKDNPNVYGPSTLLNEILNLQYKRNTAEIIYCDDMLSEKEMASIYQNTHVLVHPYRGEGFGMHVQEAVACGAFPLVTGGGATDDFINPECGLLINSSPRIINLSDPAVFAIKPGDSLSNMGDHGWVLEPDKNDFVGKMRSLYYQHNIEIMKEQVKKAKLTTWKQTAQQMGDVIERTFNNGTTTPRRFQ